jgi:AcrR family transcriptional regulator
MARIVTTKNKTKKEVITAKASLLFRKKGFAATSMRELADLIGVEASSLYNHIGSKNELLQNICFSVANDFTAHLQEVLLLSKPLQFRLEQIIRFHIRIMLERYDEVYVANHEWKQLQEPYLSNFLHQRKSYESQLVALVEQGVKEKVFSAIKPQVAVLTLLSALRGLEYWHSKNTDVKTLEQHMVQQLLHGILK